MEGNQKEAKTLIFCENFAKTKENLLFFEISEDFLSQLKNEKIFRMKGINIPINILDFLKR